MYYGVKFGEENRFRKQAYDQIQEIMAKKKQQHKQPQRDKYDKIFELMEVEIDQIQEWMHPVVEEDNPQQVGMYKELHSLEAE